MTKFFLFLTLSFYISAMADDISAIEKFSILGHKENLPTQPGSAHIIDQTEMKKFSFSDIHRLLQAVPGVNIQEEDGFGLRPNIGLRGAHPHRSKKITLMEDGVLIAPAPYSSPAAYYFPSLEKVQSLEVFKGASSIGYGPQSIGGAINMVTSAKPQGLGFDVEYGSFNLQKYQASFGVEGYGDLSLQLNRSTHDGFKELPNRAGTGFTKHNIFLRWDKFFSYNNQNLTIKLNWANENSQSSYLGLTNDDFIENSFQRYAASQKDTMDWEHRQFFLSYAISPIENWRFRATTYAHQFERSWDKFDGFYDKSLSIREILNKPYHSSNNYFYEILKGEKNSSLTNNQDSLRLTNNQRSYLSHGIQLQNTIDFDFGDSSNQLQLSYRLHQDQVDRNHTSSFYSMNKKQLMATSLPTEILKKNKSDALAHTFFIHNQVDWDKLSLSIGSRFEKIEYTQTNSLDMDTLKSSDSVIVPGAGLFYELFTGGGFLAGIHKGTTPVGPGQEGNVAPEVAINYELGFRYSGAWGFEVIGFYSDYQNILGTCTQSSGCSSSQLDERFNGGKAEVYGLESLVSFEPRWKSLSFPLRLSATLTQAKFTNSFTSQLSEWGLGDVAPGDPIPYIPLFQGNATLGVSYQKWQSHLSLQYVSSVADQAVSLERAEVPSHWVLDYALHYQILDQTKIYLKANNLTGIKYATSYRPFGLRPGKPQSFFVGLSYAL